MTKEKNEKQVINLQVTDGLTVTVLPDLNHEFLMSSEQVASGYGVSAFTIRQHKKRQFLELINGKHFVSGVTFSHSDPHNKVYWTKRGIVRLGFFIKSKQARLFRDWAEDLVINKIEQTALFENQTPIALPAKRKHNRLTQARLVDILADVCRIENSELRINLTQKLLSHE